VNVQPKGDAFDRYYGSTAEAHQIYQQSEAHMQWLGQYLQPFEDAAGHRLYADLMLLYEPEVAGRIPQAAAMQEECARLLPVLRQVTSTHAAMLNLRNVQGVLGALLHHIDGQENNGAFCNLLISYMRHLREELLKLRGQFDQFAYPFDHAQGAMSISHYLLKELPGPEELGDIVDAADGLVNRLLPMYARTLGRLCLMAEAVETVLGHAPLPTPAEPKSQPQNVAPGVAMQQFINATLSGAAPVPVPASAPPGLPNPYGGQVAQPQQPVYPQQPGYQTQPGFPQGYPQQPPCPLPTAYPQGYPQPASQPAATGYGSPNAPQQSPPRWH
jgi:hypothetical protein